MLQDSKEPQKIYSVNAIGNFWGGRYYEEGLDSFFVLVSSNREAKEIALVNVYAITEMFKNKILLSELLSPEGRSF